MDYIVYILFSQSTGKFYIGQTTNLEQRISYHNTGRVKSTKHRGPWVILYRRSVYSRAEAFKIEKKLKNLKSRKRIIAWISNHIDESSSVGPEFYQIFDLD